MIGIAEQPGSPLEWNEILPRDEWLVIARRIAHKLAVQTGLSCDEAFSTAECGMLITSRKFIPTRSNNPGAYLWVHGYQRALDEARTETQFRQGRIKGHKDRIRLIPTNMQLPRNKQMSESDRAAEIASHAISHAPDPAAIPDLEIEELREILRGWLTPAEHEIFSRHFFDGVTLCTISRERGWTNEAANVICSGSRRRLKKILTCWLRGERLPDPSTMSKRHQYYGSRSYRGTHPNGNRKAGAA